MGSSDGLGGEWGLEGGLDGGLELGSEQGGETGQETGREEGRDRDGCPVICCRFRSAAARISSQICLLCGIPTDFNPKFMQLIMVGHKFLVWGKIAPGIQQSR